MRRSLFVLVTLTSLTTIASAQSPTPLPPGAQVFFANRATTMFGRATVDDMVGRLMSFDLDRNGKIERSELPQRMQPLLLRGDANLDGVLDNSELRTLALRPPMAVNTVRGFPHGGGYGFGDDEGAISSRSHIEGALDDLRLTDAAKAQALRVSIAFMDTVEADARATLLKEMSDLLTPEQMSAFTVALDQQKTGRMRFIMRPKGGPDIRSGSMIDLRMEQFALPEAKQREGLAAVERFKDKIRPGEAEQAALVEQMNGVLTSEERDDFRAALARRPLVKQGGNAMNFAFGGVVGGGVGGIAPRGDVTIVRPAILRTVIAPPPGAEDR